MTVETQKPVPAEASGDERGRRTRLARFYDSDICYSFRHAPLVIGASLLCLLIIFVAVFAPWLAPTDPYDLKTLSLFDSLLPPFWVEGSDPRFLLGTDIQGGGLKGWQIPSMFLVTASIPSVESNF